MCVYVLGGGYVGVHVRVCLCMRVCLCRKGKLKYMYMYVNRFLPGKHIRYFLLQTTIGYFDYIKTIPFYASLHTSASTCTTYACIHISHKQAFVQSVQFSEA